MMLSPLRLGWLNDFVVSEVRSGLAPSSNLDPPFLILDLLIFGGPPYGTCDLPSWIRDLPSSTLSHLACCPPPGWRKHCLPLLHPFSHLGQGSAKDVHRSPGCANFLSRAEHSRHYSAKPRHHRCVFARCSSPENSRRLRHCWSCGHRFYGWRQLMRDC